MPPHCDRRHTTPPEEAAYLAGLIDGDGHIGLHKRPTTHSVTGYRFQADVETAGVDAESVAEIRGLVKSGCWKTTCRGFKSSRPVHRPSFTADTLHWLLPLLIPHLKLKKEQALAVIEPLGLVKKGRHGHNPRSDELYMRLKRLNRRGANP